MYIKMEFITGVFWKVAITIQIIILHDSNMLKETHI